jgi:hypothetical protein
MKRLSIVLVVIACMLLMTPTAFAASRPSASKLAGIPGGYSYAGLAINGLTSSPGSGSSTVGPLAQVGVGCSLKPATATQTIANTSLGTLASMGAVQDVVQTSRSVSSISSLAKSTIKNLDMLNGLITAGSITAVANSMGTASNATSNGATTFSGLNIDGQNISSTPGPNTTIQLAGLGYVVLNEQAGPYNGYASTGISVNAIDVYLHTTNLLSGQSSDSRVIIGHVQSNYQRTARPALVGAGSFGMYSSGTGGTTNLTSGAYAPANIGCTGGNAQQQTSSFSSSQVGRTGTISDSAAGQITANGTQASAQSNVQGLNLLGGLIQGNDVTVQAIAAWNGHGSASASTTFSNMHINGRSVSRSPSPNTTYTLPGLGTIVLNKQVIQKTSAGVLSIVYGMVITITRNNPLGLPVGAQIIVGAAGASVSI